VKIVAEAPKGNCKPVVYPIAVVKNSHNIPFAKQFIDTLMSPSEAENP
jgi:ABC-type molybdate transport system substrate-binding protein